MKVLIPVDVGYAFDFLAILQLKFNNGLISHDDVSDCMEQIESQIGKESFEKVADSKEYTRLYMANEETFVAVEQAKKDAVKASYVDACNTKRYLAKVALQKKWFPLAPVTEKKT